MWCQELHRLQHRWYDWIDATCFHYWNCNFYDVVNIRPNDVQEMYRYIMTWLFSIAGTSFKFFDQFLIVLISSNSRIVLLYLNVRWPRSKFLYVSIKINIFSYDFLVHFMCKFIQSFLLIILMKRGGKAPPPPCRNFLKSTTYMDFNSILDKKFVLFTLTMINRKWQCLNKLTSKWLNYRINTDKEQLENVLLRNIPGRAIFCP